MCMLPTEAGASWQVRQVFKEPAHLEEHTQASWMAVRAQHHCCWPYLASNAAGLLLAALLLHISQQPAPISHSQMVLQANMRRSATTTRTPDNPASPRDDPALPIIAARVSQQHLLRPDKSLESPWWPAGLYQSAACACVSLGTVCLSVGTLAPIGTSMRPSDDAPVCHREWVPASRASCARRDQHEN